jgi:hypothetical protein
MTNVVMAHSAGRLQQSLEGEIASGADLSECIKALDRVGPVAYGHINFRGTYSYRVLRGGRRTVGDGEGCGGRRPQ